MTVEEVNVWQLAPFVICSCKKQWGIVESRDGREEEMAFNSLYTMKKKKHNRENIIPMGPFFWRIHLPVKLILISC